MIRRNYRMNKRSVAANETKRRIVEATYGLHAEQGVSNTSWDEIAQRAGVGVGTVYRHFRNFDELLPACGLLTWERLNLPGPEIFDGASTQKERLHRLASELFSLYQRGEAELKNVRKEQQFHPVLAAANRKIESHLDTLVATAVSENREIVRALIDIGTWQSLRDCAVPDPAGAISEILDHALSLSRR